MNMVLKKRLEFWQRRKSHHQSGKWVSRRLLRYAAAVLSPTALGSAQAMAQGCDVYVPTHKSNSVAVVRTFGGPAPGGNLTDVIPVQVQPLSAAISPDKAFVYVTNSGWIFGSNSVSVIDTSSYRVVTTISVGFPHRRGLHAGRRFCVRGE
jgi:YVTN family beta-propeller protein